MEYVSIDSAQLERACAPAWASRFDRPYNHLDKHAKTEITTILTHLDGYQKVQRAREAE